MASDNKLYVALGVLAVLGGALFFANKKEKETAAQYTLTGQTAALPKLAFTDDDLKAVDKIVLKKPAGEDGGAPKDIELVKKGDEWRVEARRRAREPGEREEPARQPEGAEGLGGDRLRFAVV
jgi:LPXTG-motif cell wall-anchored protein